MHTGVYFSRSFHDEDHAAFDAVLSVFKDQQVANEFSLDLFDSSEPFGDQAYERVTADLTRAEIVVCIFTRRHQIAGSSGFTTPTMVCSEATFAHARGKSLLLFLEEGVDIAETGLISCLSLEQIRFRRAEVGTVRFHERLLKVVLRRLRAFSQASSPSYRFSRYVLNHTVYANGYVMSHRKLDVEIFDPEDPITHMFALQSADERDRRIALPGAAQLMDNANESLPPFPHAPFVAFAANVPDATLRPAPRQPKDNARRQFEVRFTAAGRYHYEWIWGLPESFDAAAPLDYLWIAASQHPVTRLEIALRLQRPVAGRREPKWATIMPADSDLATPIAPEAIYARARPPKRPQARVGPFFTCYEFEVSPERGTDVIVLF